MGDVAVLCLFHNVLIFGIIFWVLTWGAEYYFAKKNFTCRKQFYECGFRSLSELNIQVNMHFTMVCVFLVLYDVEFIFLYPLVFQFWSIGCYGLFIALFFISLIVISLVYDWKYNALSLQY